MFIDIIIRYFESSTIPQYRNYNREPSGVPREIVA